ncbi:MAG: hypothetical protein U0K19_02400, partial [Bifidobacteriaceae bacterium]|nr:hypothetical protein [Bifidobacteriaceae bacterium]
LSCVRDRLICRSHTFVDQLPGSHRAAKIAARCAGWKASGPQQSGRKLTRIRRGQLAAGKGLASLRLLISATPLELISAIFMASSPLLTTKLADRPQGAAMAY